MNKIYTVGDIFEIKPTKHITKENILGPGKTLVITGGESNYGVSGYYTLDAEYTLEKGNCLTFCRTTDFVAYRDSDFLCLDSVAALRHPKLNRYIGLYLAAVLSQKTNRYSFGRKRLSENVKKEKILLPSVVYNDSTYEPDWSYMENYMKEINDELIKKIKDIL